MNDSQTRPAADATLTPLTEEELADWRRDQGRRVVRHRSRWWWASRPGFYRPIHLLARLSAAEATRPTPACWGFHATLRDEDASAANAALPAHRVTDLGSFDESHLSSNRRYQLRKARRLTTIVQLTGPRLLEEQGHAVHASSIERTGFGDVKPRDAYVHDVSVSLRPRRRFVLAGLVDGRLAAYVEGYAAGTVAYLEDLVIATDALTTNVSTALQFEFVYAAQRTPGIDEVVHGIHAPDDPQLTMYKERLGFPVQPVPARMSMLPGATVLMRKRAPDAFYRMTGVLA
jgi:hypothetical protein